MTKPKIVIVSDSPMGYTGFGQVTDKIATYLHQTQKYQIAVVGWGYDGWGHNKPYPLFPARAQDFGKAEFPTILKRLNPDVLLTIADIRMISYVANSFVLGSCRWIGYFPIDGKPVPYQWLNTIQYMDHSVCFSHWGRDVIKAAGELHSVNEVIPLGVDICKFKPSREIDKIEVLKAIGIPCLPGSEYRLSKDVFIIGTVARNQPNKNFDRVIKAFAEFRRVEKRKSILYLHTRPNDLHIDLIKYAKRYGVEERVWFRKEPILPSDMPAVYNMMDVFFLPSSNEGFCLPYLEAAACGIPVIGTQYGGPSDFLNRIGWGIKVRWPNDFIPSSQTLVEKAQPSISECVRLLVHASKIPPSYSKREKRINILSKYDWNRILPKWDKVLDKTLNSKAIGIQTV